MGVETTAMAAMPVKRSFGLLIRMNFAIQPEDPGSEPLASTGAEPAANATASPGGNWLDGMSRQSNPERPPCRGDPPMCQPPSGALQGAVHSLASRIGAGAQSRSHLCQITLLEKSKQKRITVAFIELLQGLIQYCSNFSP